MNENGWFHGNLNIISERKHNLLFERQFSVLWRIFKEITLFFVTKEFLISLKLFEQIFIFFSVIFGKKFKSYAVFPVRILW